MDVLVEDTDGVVGGNLLGDAVDGTARAVELTHIHRIDSVARIGGGDSFEVGAVPSGRGLSVDHRGEAGLKDDVVDEGVVGVGAGVVGGIFGLRDEVAAIVLRGEGKGAHGVVVAVEEALVGAEGVDVLLSGSVVNPRGVSVGHHGEDEAVLVPGIGVEVHVAGAAVVAVAGQDVGGALTEELTESLFGLSGIQGGAAFIGQRVDILSVPGVLPIGTVVGRVDTIRGEEHAGTVDEAIAAFPKDFGHVVGDTHLLVDERGQRVVEGTAGIVGEVEHGEGVLVAVVESDGAAVAVPERVACADDEAHVVVAETHAGKRAEHDGGVFGMFVVYPGFGAAELDAVHEVEEHLAVVRDGVHYRVVRAGAAVLPAGRVLVVVSIASDQGVGVPVVAILVAGDFIAVERGDDDGLHFLPFAGEPDAVLGEGFDYLLD